MVEHVPEEIRKGGWFRKEYLHSPKKVEYMDHVLGCASCRADLEASLATAFDTLDAHPREVGIERSLVRFMLSRNENTYRDIEEVVAEKLRR